MNQEETEPAGDPLSEEEKIEFLGRAIKSMAEFTFPYIASVIRVEGDDTGTFCGSAWRVAANGRRALVTAAHVIDEAALSGTMVAVTAQRGAPPWPAPASEWKRSADDDLAVWYAPDAYSGGAGEPLSFWREDAIDPSAAHIGADFLFVHGFPQARSRFSPGLGGVVTTSFPYGSTQRLETLTDVKLSPREFALHFEVEGLLTSSAGAAEFTLPNGLSGSAVWRLDIGGRRISSWSPEAARIVGVAVRWSQNDQALVVLHAQQVIALLKATSV